LLAKFRKNIESCKKYNDVLLNIEVAKLKENGHFNLIIDAVMPGREWGDAGRA